MGRRTQSWAGALAQASEKPQVAFQSLVLALPQHLATLTYIFMTS